MVPLIFLGAPSSTSDERAVETCQNQDQTVLEFRLVLQREFEERIRAVEGKFLADIVAVIFDCAVVDKQLCSD